MTSIGATIVITGEVTSGEDVTVDGRILGKPASRGEAAEMLAAAGDLPVWVKPNAGVPKIVGAEVVYEAGPEMLAEHAVRFVEQGARIVGGCCGSTPAHVAAVARALGR